MGYTIYPTCLRQVSALRDDAVEKLWWLRLQSNLSLEGFRTYLSTYGDKPYDYLQAAMLGLMLLQPTLDAINPDTVDNIRQLIVDSLDRGSEPDNQRRWLNTARMLTRTIAEEVNDRTGNQIPDSLIRTVLGNNTSTNLPDQDESEEGYENFFCSEFVTGALRAGGVIRRIDPEQITPIDLCRFHLYNDDYTQFKGETAWIRGFNCVDPSRWVPAENA